MPCLSLHEPNNQRWNKLLAPPPPPPPAYYCCCAPSDRFELTRGRKRKEVGRSLVPRSIFHPRTHPSIHPFTAPFLFLLFSPFCLPETPFDVRRQAWVSEGRIQEKERATQTGRLVYVCVMSASECFSRAKKNL